MFEFVLRRVLYIIPVILVVSAVTFFLMYRAPGGPWSNEKPLPASTVAALNEKFGLDKPLWFNPAGAGQAIETGERNPLAITGSFLDSQFFNYMAGVARLDFGPSYASKGADSVQSVIVEKFPVSLRIGLVGIVFAVLVG
ncbi:MAG: ABC transporter permease, partial [Chloroflexia bacterium]|nr:ABC transporter permease [Chloroflexia bacterium]